MDRKVIWGYVVGIVFLAILFFISFQSISWVSTTESNLPPEEKFLRSAENTIVDPLLPPGEWIAFSRGSSHNSPDTELYAVRPDGSELLQITNNSDSDWQPRISPDGTKLAYCRYPTTERAYLHVIYLLTGKDEMVTDAIFCGDSFHWLADSNRIIYQAGGQARIIDITSKDVVIVRGTLPGVRHPSISPDMQQIAYSAEPWALYVQSIECNGSDVHTVPGKDPRGAIWSPDGNWIAFESYLGNLFVTKVDGSSLIPIGRGFVPAWSPNGTKISYISADFQEIVVVSIHSDGSVSGNQSVVSQDGWISYVSWGEVAEISASTSE